MDNFKIDTMFMKVIASKFIKRFIKTKVNVNFKDFNLNEFQISHKTGEDVHVMLSLDATMSEGELTALIQRLKLL